MDISPHVGNPESPPLRSTVLGFGASFLRSRPRATSQADNSQSLAALSHNNIQPDLGREPPSSQPRSQSGALRTGGVQGNNSHTVQPSHNLAGTASDSAPPVATSTSLGLSMLRRRRSAGTANAVMSSALVNRPTAPAPSSTSSGASHRIRLVPHLDSRRTLRFDVICRNVKEGDTPLRIGRFTDRSGQGLAAANATNSNKLAFKSKVVSRAHAEIWVDAGGKFFIKDTKSSSGTFLNHVRLSAANTESKPHQIKDGDILQLGVDYQGGTEDMYKSVKIRIELGREWQAAANAFNTNALHQLKSLAVSPAADPSQGGQGASKKSQKTSIPDCCICLFSVTIRQALFIAPCSHAFHYKCIRPLLEAHCTAFSCPLCRTFADLEEDVEVEAEADVDVEDEDEIRGPGHEYDLEGADRFGSGSRDGETATNGANHQPPSTRTRNKSREREGAETEVEADAGVLRMQRSRTRVQNMTSDVLPVSDLAQADDLHDAEMADALDFGGRTAHLPTPSGPYEPNVGVDADAVDATRSTSLSPDFTGQGGGYTRHPRYTRAGTSGGAGAGVYTCEGEGSGGSAEEVMMEAEFGNEGNEGSVEDMTVGGKRKR